MDYTMILIGVAVALVVLVTVISMMGEKRPEVEYFEEEEIEPEPKEEIVERIVERRIERRQQMALYRLKEELDSRETHLELEEKRHQISNDKIAFEKLQIAEERERAFYQQEQKMNQVKTMLDGFRMTQREWKLEQGFKELQQYNRDVQFLEKQMDADHQIQIQKLSLERKAFEQVMRDKEYALGTRYDDLKHQARLLQINEKNIAQKQRSIQQDRRDLRQDGRDNDLSKKDMIIEIEGRTIDQKQKEAELYFQKQNMLLDDREIDGKLKIIHAIQDGWHVRGDWEAVSAYRKHGYKITSPLIPLNDQLEKEVRELKSKINSLLPPPEEK